MKARLRNDRLTPVAIRQWRAHMGWTQVKMAALLGITQATLAQWEAGARFPPFYLGYALNWLQHQHGAQTF
jgi:DNA-binding transcriptional regulator YiaG